MISPATKSSLAEIVPDGKVGYVVDPRDDLRPVAFRVVGEDDLRVVVAHQVAVDQVAVQLEAPIVRAQRGTAFQLCQSVVPPALLETLNQVIPLLTSEMLISTESEMTILTLFVITVMSYEHLRYQV